MSSSSLSTFFGAGFAAGAASFALAAAGALGAGAAATVVRLIKKSCKEEPFKLFAKRLAQTRSTSIPAAAVIAMIQSA